MKLTLETDFVLSSVGFFRTQGFTKYNRIAWYEMLTGKRCDGRRSEIERSKQKLIEAGLFIPKGARVPWLSDAGYRTAQILKISKRRKLVFLSNDWLILWLKSGAGECAEMLASMLRMMKDARFRNKAHLVATAFGISNASVVHSRRKLERIGYYYLTEPKICAKRKAHYLCERAHGASRCIMGIYHCMDHILTGHLTIFVPAVFTHPKGINHMKKRKLVESHPAAPGANATRYQLEQWKRREMRRMARERGEYMSNWIFQTPEPFEDIFDDEPPSVIDDDDIWF